MHSPVSTLRLPLSKGKLSLSIILACSIGVLCISFTTTLIVPRNISVLSVPGNVTQATTISPSAQPSDVPNIGGPKQLQKLYKQATASLVHSLDNNSVRLHVTLNKKKDGVLEFVHIPKTGGTAVEAAAARKNLTWGMCHYMNMPGGSKDDFPGCFVQVRRINPCGHPECWHKPPSLLVNQTEWTNPYDQKNLFAVVRNPYKRVLSEYYCPWKGYKKPNKNRKTLNSFVHQKLNKYRIDDPRHPRDAHLIPQSQFIFDIIPNEQEAATQQLVDHVLFYEDFANQFHALMKEYDLPITLDSHKVNPGKTGKVPRMGLGDLDPETIGLINEVYRDDFATLGYTMVNPDELEEDWAKAYNDKSTLMMPFPDVAASCTGNINKTITDTPTIIPIPSSRATFLHLGKAGGGSIGHRLDEFWGIKMREIHPFPRPEKLVEANDTFWIVSIRDPIDRFVSAINWRLVVLCSPLEGETRTVGPQPWNQPEKYCRTTSEQEMDILFYKYNQSANLLAEAMCSGGEGQQDVQHVEHASDSIQDWLTTPSGNLIPSLEGVLPIVIEKGFELNLQTDATVDLLQNQLGLFNTTTTFQSRRQVVRQLDCQKALASQNTESKSFQHSSVQHGKNTVLTQRATECLKEYYSKDYDLLEKMKHESCRTEECQASIQSILDRRRVGNLRVPK